MTSWMGEWDIVETDFSYNDYPYRSMAVWDDKLWALVENYGVSPQLYKILNSEDGDNWTQRFTGNNLHELLTFDDKLYALGNVAQDAQIVDLSSGSVIEVARWKAAGVYSTTATSFDTDGDIIRIVGHDRDLPSNWKFRHCVWTYDGSITSDYSGDWTAPVQFDRPNSICFHDWTWFFAGYTEAWIRNGLNDYSQIDNGDFVGFYDTFYRSTPYGAFISRFRYDRGGTWIDTDTVNQQVFDSVEDFHGHIIGVNHGDGHVWSSTSSGNIWIDRGKMFNNAAASDYYVCDWEIFQDRLYGCGGRTGSASYIWRLNAGIAKYFLTAYFDRPTASLLKVDHEFGDTVYIGMYNEGDFPLALWIDDEFSTDDGTLIFSPSAGSFIGVQTAEHRNTVYVYGHLGTDKQIELSVDRGVNFTDCDDDWGEDKITTMEYLPSSGSDLTITNYEDKDLLRTTSGSASWTKRGDIPGWPLSQLRHTGGSIIFVGCTGGNLFKSEDIGVTYNAVGSGLPAVDILDLEIA